MQGATRLERDRPTRARTDAARKRAVVEIVARHEAALKRTARRYSLDAEDAEDAYQRALEIVLTKAPTTDLRELIRWTQTVTKHEALAVRASRERLLGRQRPSDRDAGEDPLAQLAADAAGPAEQVQRREDVARSREALRTLKPAELRALTLLAEGYSYAEIGEMTGFSRTKVNRVLAEGRERFRSVLASSEDGSRCRVLGPLLSAFCDGEASPAETGEVREHLRACARCRSTMRAYRAVPGIAAALAPALPLSRSLLERAHDLLAEVGARLPRPGEGGSGATQIAASGSAPGGGLVAGAKLLTLCAGVAGGAACVATGVLPAPTLSASEPSSRPAIERQAEAPAELPPAAPQLDPTPQPSESAKAKVERHPQPRAPDTSPEASAAPPVDEYAAPAAPPEPASVPAPAPTPAPTSDDASGSSGSAAGEFGP